DLARLNAGDDRLEVDGLPARPTPARAPVDLRLPFAPLLLGPGAHAAALRASAESSVRSISTWLSPAASAAWRRARRPSASSSVPASTCSRRRRAAQYSKASLAGSADRRRLRFANLAAEAVERGIRRPGWPRVRILRWPILLEVRQVADDIA